MTSPTPFGRSARVVRVPRGEVIGEYETYPEAAAAVDRLTKAEFDVTQVSIVGSDLKMVERVVRRLSWGRAALEGILAGAWFGLFLALLLTLFEPTINWGVFGAAILIGAGFGMLFRLASYAFSRRVRDFESTSQVIASGYQVIVPAEAAEAARMALARASQDSRPDGLSL